MLRLLLFIGLSLFLTLPIARSSAQTKRPPHVVTSLTDVVYAVRFSPDGRTLAIARGTRDDNRVELWDLESATLRHTIRGFDGAIWSVSFAPDGQTLVTASGGIHRERIAERPGERDGHPFTELKWWDARSGDLKQRIEVPGEDILSVTALYSPDGKQLAAVEQRAQPFIEIFDDRSSNSNRFPRLPPPVRAALFAVDLKLLDAGTGEVKLKLRGDLSYGNAMMRGFSRRDASSIFLANQRQPLIYAPGGQLIVAWNSTEIRFWNVTSGEEIRKLKDFKGRLGGVSFSPDGRTIAAAITKFTWKKNQPDYKSELRTWDVLTGAPRQVIPLSTQSVSGVAFAPNGQQVLIGGLQRDDAQSFATLELADLRSGSLGKLIGKDQGTISSIVLSPNGVMLAFQTDASTVNLVDTREWKIRQNFDANSDSETHNTATGRFLLTVNTVKAVAFSPDSKTVVGEIDPGEIKLWDSRTGEVKKQFSAPDRAAKLIEISSNGETVAQVNDNDSLSWRNTFNENEAMLTLKNSSITALAVSADGRRIAIADRGRLIVLNTGTRQTTEMPSAPLLERLAFSDDGERLAASSDGDIVDIWNIDKQQIEKSVRSPATVTSLRFAPGANLLACGTAEGNIDVWNLQTGTVALHLKKHKAAVNAIAFSVKGDMMASGGDDRTVILWDVASGKSRRTLKGHDLTVTSLAFSVDGSLLVVGSGNSSAVLWNPHTGKLDRVLK